MYANRVFLLERGADGLMRPGRAAIQTPVPHAPSRTATERSLTGARSLIARTAQELKRLRSQSQAGAGEDPTIGTRRR